MPDPVAEVDAQVDAGEDDVDVLPVVHAECDAIRGRAVDAPRLDAGDVGRPAVCQRTGSGDSVTG